MKLNEFKEEVRRVRGTLKDMDVYLDKIYREGIMELRDLCINSKQMGIKNISELTNLTFSEQFEWYEWIVAKGFKATKNELELKISSILIRGM
jgi:hypothetical protein